MFPVFILALLGQVAASAAIFDASRATLSAPSTVLEIDSSKLQGSPVRLAWGDDGSLFLRAAETDRWGNERGRNYVLTPGKPEPTPVAEEPAWAATYWAWKSGPVAPGVPSLRLDVETRQQPKTAVGSTADVSANPNRSDSFSTANCQRHGVDAAGGDHHREVQGPAGVRGGERAARARAHLRLGACGPGRVELP